MGRKSRRNNDTMPVIAVQNTDIFPTAIYARLSVENSGKDDDGAAIENQIDVCKEYIRDMPDLQLVKVYQDNGWTGTNMNRPSFDEMMDAVRTGKIRAIVVRDLSRFSRNYIETGTYLERIFPMLDVRFISVKEQFDTLRADGSNDSLMVPLQSLINDLYAKDISRKIHAVYDVQKKEGNFSWRLVPYGYRWNDEHTNIVPDDEQAENVRDIFRWKIEGLTYKEISEKLAEKGAKTYYQIRGKDVPAWSTTTINGILSNPVYMGNKVYGCRKAELYKGLEQYKVPESEWYVVENAHEAIISPGDFESVKQILQRAAEDKAERMKKNSAIRKKLVNLFQAKIVCADCGYKMYYSRHRTTGYEDRWYGEYHCGSNQARKYLGCTPHYIMQTVIEKKVFEAIRLQVKTALDYEELIRIARKKGSDKGLKTCLENQLRSARQKLRRIQDKRTRLYEDYVEGILDGAEYAFAKKHYESEYESIEMSYEKLSIKLNDLQEAFSTENKWITLMKSVRNAKKLSQALVDAVVDQIRVYDGGSIEVVMKYQDVYEMTGNYIRQVENKS